MDRGGEKGERARGLGSHKASGVWLAAQSNTVRSALMPGRTGALSGIASPCQGSLV